PARKGLKLCIMFNVVCSAYDFSKLEKRDEGVLSCPIGSARKSPPSLPFLELFTHDRLYQNFRGSMSGAP
ncbi:MAG TPA: hypothetical protein VJ904_07960, partial [Tichowtungia sp.]|nr:hypothetical protein [Tichowtungia sp.]